MAHRLASLLVVGALVLPGLARGQTTAGTLTVTESNDPNESPPTINADECNGTDPDGKAVTDNLTFLWTFTSGFKANDQVRIDVSNKSTCATTNGTDTFTGTLVPSFPGNGATDQWPRQSDTSTKVTAQQLVAALPAGAGINCATNTNPPVWVCAFDTSANVLAVGSITLNTLAPAAPTGVTVTPGDSALNVAWTPSTGSPSATSYLVRAMAVDPTQDSVTHDKEVTGSSFRLAGLTNGVQYNVFVYAFSQFHNRSAASSPAATGKPEPVIDFWTGYKTAGGVEQGGCAVGSAGALALLFLPLLFWRRRRS